MVENVKFPIASLHNELDKTVGRRMLEGNVQCVSTLIYLVKIEWITQQRKLHFSWAVKLVSSQDRCLCARLVIQRNITKITYP